MAIELDFKPCCIKCSHVDADRIERESLDFLFDGSQETIVTVYCTHERVCKTFLESNDKMLSETEYGKD